MTKRKRQKGEKSNRQMTKKTKNQRQKDECQTDKKIHTLPIFLFSFRRRLQYHNISWQEGQAPKDLETLCFISYAQGE